MSLHYHPHTTILTLERHFVMHRPSSPAEKANIGAGMLSKLKGAAKGIATTNALKVKKVEDMFR